MCPTFPPSESSHTMDRNSMPRWPYRGGVVLYYNKRMWSIRPLRMSIQLHQSAVGKLIAKRGSRSARLGKRDLLGGEGRRGRRLKDEGGRRKRCFESRPHVGNEG